MCAGRIRIIAAAAFLAWLNCREGVVFAADFIPGIKAGYSKLAGYYDGELNSGPYAGIFLLYQASAFPKYLKAEADFSFARYAFGKSTDSAIYSFPFSIGPLFCYPISPRIELYAGLSAKGQYMYIHAENTGRDDTTFKFGGVAKTGVFIPVGAGISARIDIGYEINSLSGKDFQTINLTAGVMYNHNLFLRNRTADETDSRELKAARLYAEALDFFNQGDCAKAREKFSGVLKLDTGHRGAAEHLKKIAAIEESYAKAGELISKKNYYEAIPHLENASGNMAAAKSELIRIRKILSAEIPGLEKQGIEAYEKNDFGACIGAMKKIQLIDPDNDSVKLYLPRAQKRHEALYRLK